MNNHFQLECQFSIFYQFLYFWNVFANITNQQNAQNSSKRNSKTKGRINMKIGTDVNLHRATKPWSLIFDIYFQIWIINLHRATKPWSLIFDIYFQVWIMSQSFLIGWLPVAMATISKIRLHGFERNVLKHHLPKYGETCNISFLSYVC